MRAVGFFDVTSLFRPASANLRPPALGASAESTDHICSHWTSSSRILSTWNTGSSPHTRFLLSPHDFGEALILKRLAAKENPKTAETSFPLEIIGHGEKIKGSALTAEHHFYGASPLLY